MKNIIILSVIVAFLLFNTSNIISSIVMFTTQAKAMTSDKVLTNDADYLKFKNDKTLLKGKSDK